MSTRASPHRWDNPFPKVAYCKDISIQICEYSAGLRIRLVMPQRIALSEYSGILLSFFHSGSLTNFAPGPALVTTGEKTAEG